MTTQQFLKGLLMTVVAVIVAAFNSTPVDYLLLAVTAACAILTYTGKNLLPWFSFLHSDSPAGTLSVINLISALLIAIGTGVLESVGLFLVNGSIDWVILGKVVLSVTFTYLGGTWLAPPYNTEKKRLIAGKRYIQRYMKGAAFVGLFLLLSAGVSAQDKWEGFFRPKAGLPVTTVKEEGEKFSQMYFRPAAQMTALQFTWDKELKQFQSSSFSAVGIGIGYQNYVERNGVLVNSWGVNGLIILDGSQSSAGIGGAVTVNALSFVNIGIGYSFTNKQIFIPIGAIYTF